MKDILFLIAGLLANIPSEATGYETVWVRDVTAKLQADKRALDDLDLPDQLTFDFMRGLDNVTLNLKRNYEIDPNADIYVVRKLKNGRSFLARTNELENENGNIRIGGYTYGLRPVRTDVVSGHMSKVPSVIGKRYVLLDEADIEQENILERYDTENVSGTNVKEELNARLPRFTGQRKQNSFHPLDVTLPRYVTDLQDKTAQDTTRQLRQNYYVKIAALIDFGVWSLYASRVHLTDPLRKKAAVRWTIREAFSHIMNGVNLRYKTIDDPSISISIILQQFVFFEDELLFPHNLSRVIIENGTKYIDAYLYFGDIKEWVMNVGNTMVPAFDHAMLFTIYDLYEGSITRNTIAGLSADSSICNLGYRYSLIEINHYSLTVHSSAHELGHNLGADHDGEKSAIACKAEDLFIMNPSLPYVNITTPYSRNPFMFSNCSVEAFKKTLISKQCVKYNGSVYDTAEWTMFMKKQPGDVFTPSEQCWILYGPNYIHNGVVDENICNRLTCVNLKRRTCFTRYMYAARGTKCGENMWCIQGKCVLNGSK